MAFQPPPKEDAAHHSRLPCRRPPVGPPALNADALQVPESISCVCKGISISSIRHTQTRETTNNPNPKPSIRSARHTRTRGKKATPPPTHTHKHTIYTQKHITSTPHHHPTNAPPAGARLEKFDRLGEVGRVGHALPLGAARLGRAVQPGPARRGRRRRFPRCVAEGRAPGRRRPCLGKGEPH